MFTRNINPLNKTPGSGGYPSLNLFDSDDETISSGRAHYAPPRTSPEPALTALELGTNPFDDENKGSRKSIYIYSHNLEKRNKFNNCFQDSGGLENQTVQELKEYAVHKAEETTKIVNNCLKIAENIREDASKTLVLLHHKGKQITKAHTLDVDIDNNLSRGEQLLASPGDLFSRTWKITKTHAITRPSLTRDEPVRRKDSLLEQCGRLGLMSALVQPPTNVLQRVSINALQRAKLEKAKQDDCLSKLSNLLDELKDMAVEMGSEIDRQNKASDPLRG